MERANRELDRTGYGAKARSRRAHDVAPALREPRGTRAAAIAAHWPLWLLGGHAVWLLRRAWSSIGPVRAAPEWLSQGVPLLGILVAAMALGCGRRVRTPEKLTVAPTTVRGVAMHVFAVAVMGIVFVAACLHGPWMAVAGWGGQLLLATAVLGSLWTAAALCRAGCRLRTLPSGVMVERHGDLLLRLERGGDASLLRPEPPLDGGHAGMRLTLASLCSESSGGTPYRSGLPIRRAPSAWEGDAVALARGAFVRSARWVVWALGSATAWALLAA